MNIALTGHLRSGKDAIAAHLVTNYGYTRFAFGDGIREVTRRLYPEQYVGGAKPRALLQGFGQMARTFGEDVWVNDCFRRIEAERWVYDGGHKLWEVPNFRTVISDLRQPNELARCRSEGYAIIRVKAKSALRIQRAVESADTFNLADLTHSTETHIDGFAVDYEITNDGSLAELYEQIDEVMKRVNLDAK